VYGDGHAHCYGCGFHGDIFDLFQAVEGGELWVAVISLAHRYGVELPERPKTWYRKQRRQDPVRRAIRRTRIEILRRRLFRWCVLPLVDVTTSDERERRAEIERAWREFQSVPVEMLLNRWEEAA
jgi:hypothetical protein